MTINKNSDIATTQFVYNTINSRLTILMSNAAAQTVLKLVAPIPSWCGFYGNEPNKLLTGSNGLSLNNGIQATNELDLTTPNVIFLRFNDGASPALNIDNLITAKGSSQNLRNILARIQLNQPPNAIVFNNSALRSTTNYLQIPDTYSTRILTTMHFEWIDEYNNPIDFNGVEHTMLLRIFVSS